MKKRYLIIIPILLLTLTTSYSKTDKTGQSFMFTRPIYHNVASEQALWHNLVHSDKHLSRFQFVPMGQESIDSDSVKEYFLMSNKQELYVTCDSIASGTGHDVRAEWLGIDNSGHNFSGKLSINPQQKQYGIVAEYQTDLSKFWPNSFLKYFWIGATVPIVYVSNNLNISQSDIQNEGTDGIADILEGFSRPALEYSKMDGQHSAKGIPEIKLKLGVKYMSKGGFQISAGTTFIAPTIASPANKYVFEPILGNTKHIGFGTTINFNVPLSAESNSFEVSWFLDAENNYFFKKESYRVLDLKDKPWSRYLLVRKEGESKTIPAANILNIKLKVKPHDYSNLATGFRLKGESFEGEIAYGLWAHPSEKLELKDSFSTKYGIAGTGTNSASASTIATLAANDSTFTTISESDLSLTSAAAKSAVVHQIHGSFGWFFDKKTMVEYWESAYLQISHNETPH